MLADVALANLLFHLQQPGRLLFGQLEDRNPGSTRKHLSDRFFVNLGRNVLVSGLPRFFLLSAGLSQLALVVTQTCCHLEILGIDSGFFFQPDCSDLFVKFAQIRRSSHSANPKSGACLVDQVNRLVRQEAIRDVTRSHLRGRCQCTVSDGDPVMCLVAIAKPTKNVNGQSDRRLGHLNWLEPTLQRRIFLNVLAVLIQGGSTNGLQLSASKHRFENGCRIDRTFSGTGPHQGVDLIDEQHYIATRLDLFEHLL